MQPGGGCHPASLFVGRIRDVAIDGVDGVAPVEANAGRVFTGVQDYQLMLVVGVVSPRVGEGCLPLRRLSTWPLYLSHLTISF